MKDKLHNGCDNVVADLKKKINTLQSELESQNFEEALTISQHISTKIVQLDCMLKIINLD